MLATDFNDAVDMFHGRSIPKISALIVRSTHPATRSFVPGVPAMLRTYVFSQDTVSKYRCKEDSECEPVDDFMCCPETHMCEERGSASSACGKEN